ncbi:hypothetical protein [Nonomuraea sp. LPB2021202275-12-8]|uniref:hypothetical protein n=1 Tax=Nonomuraea sp. LPB2021202275-12-8 TaxID=3120159 RepID=UPI00300D40ED
MSTYGVDLHAAALAQMKDLPGVALDALVARVVDLVEEPWDARIADGNDPRYRRTTFGQGHGLISFFVDEPARLIRIFDVTWAGEVR